jgi:hypothetical protein
MMFECFAPHFAMRKKTSAYSRSSKGNGLRPLSHAGGHRRLKLAARALHLPGVTLGSIERIIDVLRLQVLVTFPMD